MKDGVVATGGVFDFFHAGHASLLRYCKALTSVVPFVVVFMNSDKSVERLRGHPPLLSQNLRKLTLEACRWVDRVIIFDEDTPCVKLVELKPEIFVKGADYKEGIVIPETDVVEFYGGGIVFAPILEIDGEKISSSALKQSLVANFDLDKMKECNTVDNDHDWGYQIRMVNEDEYCGKLLVLENTERGGYHFHKEKKETFIILQGSVKMHIDSPSIDSEVYDLLDVGKWITIQPGEAHWMEAVYATAIILEVSTKDDDEDTHYVAEGS